MTSLRSTDLSIFFDGLEDPPFKVDVAAIPNKRLNVEILGDDGEENQEVSTSETDEETLGEALSQEDREELDKVENEMVAIVLASSTLDNP